MLDTPTKYTTCDPRLGVTTYQNFKTLVEAVFPTIPVRRELRMYDVRTDMGGVSFAVEAGLFDTSYYVCLQHPKLGDGTVVRLHFDVHNRSYDELRDELITKLTLVLS